MQVNKQQTHCKHTFINFKRLLKDLIKLKRVKPKKKMQRKEKRKNEIKNNMKTSLETIDVVKKKPEKQI